MSGRFHGPSSISGRHARPPAPSRRRLLAPFPPTAYHAPPGHAHPSCSAEAHSAERAKAHKRANHRHTRIQALPPGPSGHDHRRVTRCSTAGARIISRPRTVIRLEVHPLERRLLVRLEPNEAVRPRCTTGTFGLKTTTSPSRYSGSIESPTTRAPNASGVVDIRHTHVLIRHPRRVTKIRELRRVPRRHLVDHRHLSGQRRYQLQRHRPRVGPRRHRIQLDPPAGEARPNRTPDRVRPVRDPVDANNARSRRAASREVATRSRTDAGVDLPVGDLNKLTRIEDPAPTRADQSAQRPEADARARPSRSETDSSWRSQPARRPDSASTRAESGGRAAPHPSCARRPKKSQNPRAHTRSPVRHMTRSSTALCAVMFGFTIHRPCKSFYIENIFPVCSFYIVNT